MLSLFDFLLPLFTNAALSKNYELLKSAKHKIFSCVESKRARWGHLARSGTQWEHRIRFIMPTGAASYLISDMLFSYEVCTNKPVPRLQLILHWFHCYECENSIKKENYTKSQDVN